jgi:hypothetical protein
MTDPINTRIPLRELERRIKVRAILSVITVTLLNAGLMWVFNASLYSIGPMTLLFSGSILVASFFIRGTIVRERILEIAPDLDKLLMPLFRKKVNGWDTRWISADDGIVKIPADDYLEWRDQYYRRQKGILKIMNYARAHQGELPDVEMLLPSNTTKEEQEAFRLAVLDLMS